VVALGNDGFTPVCKLNICSVNKKVLYNGTCVALGDPCDVDDRRVYGVDEETLEVTCLQPYFLVRAGTDDQETTKKTTTNKCSKGTKRRYQKICT
jgi:hypothetical protein